MITRQITRQRKKTLRTRIANWQAKLAALEAGDKVETSKPLRMKWPEDAVPSQLNPERET
jgi:hypothetical protein